jgi:hypothetical protein
MRVVKIITFEDAREILAKSKNIINQSTLSRVKLDKYTSDDFSITLFDSSFNLETDNFPRFLNIDVFIKKYENKLFIELTNWCDDEVLFHVGDYLINYI